MLLRGLQEDTCTYGVSLHNRFLVPVVCLRLNLVLWFKHVRFLATLFFFLIVLIGLFLNQEGFFLCYFFVSLAV